MVWAGSVPCHAVRVAYALRLGGVGIKLIKLIDTVCIRIKAEIT
jgi:hypothetical protein